jgi:arylsulfatase A-like enzyme
LAKSERNNTPPLGFKATIGIAALVGLIGGWVFGVLDSGSVIFHHASAHIALGEILSLTLYSVSLYAVLGCLGMALIGVVTGGVIKVGKYSVKKSQLAGVFIGVFAFLAIYILTPGTILGDNAFDIVVSTVIPVLSGVGLGGLSVYVLDKGSKKEKLIAVCISSFISLQVLAYGILWLNFGLLSKRAVFSITSFSVNIGLFVIATLLGVGLYKLSRLILIKYERRRVRQAGLVIVAIMASAFIAISFIGPFDSNHSQEYTTSPAGDNRAVENSGDLKGKPNILWIVMDTVRADHLSCYGYYRDTTPNIDEIASEGILFENAISAAPWTPPSHASMFTGMFPSRHGMDAEHMWLDEDFQTVAEVLRLHGYRTFAYSNNPHIDPTRNLSQGFDTLEVTQGGKLKAGSQLTDLLKATEIKIIIQNYLLMDDGARRTNEVVKKWISDAHQEETPFFVFINYMEAHARYHPPESYAMPYLPEDVNMAEAMSVGKGLLPYITGRVEYDAEDFEILRALYDGEISYLDFKMGQLFDYMEELKILDNTILIIAADHGENFGEHHLVQHAFCVYDTLLHVPLIIRYPASFEAGIRVDEQVQLTDIFPTLLDITGIDWNEKGLLQGRSLVKGGQESESAFAIAEYAIWIQEIKKLAEDYRKFDISKYARRLKTVRTEEFKYIWASDGRDELYNIRQDPGELDNIIEDEPEKAMEMRALLVSWLNSFEPYRPEAALQVQQLDYTK